MSRNFEIALHVGETGVILPDTPPAGVGMVLTAKNIPSPGNAVITEWAQAGAGPNTLPAATRAGQVIVAGGGPTFDWGAGDIDMGSY